MSKSQIKKKKKILILSATIGNGHMSPANAVKQAMDLQYPGKYDVEVIDFIAVLGKILNTGIQQTSYKMWKYTPNLYKKLFWRTDSKRYMRAFNRMHYPLIYNRIKKLLKEADADILLSVYPIWHYAVTSINAKHKFSPLFVSLITDSISVHRAWITGEIDYHLVANKDTEEILLGYDVPKEKIRNFGLPIRLEFMEKINKKDLCKELGLDPKQPIILSIPTGDNSKKVCQQFEELMEAHKEKNIIVVTGRNETAHKKLLEYETPKNTRILGFTRDLHKYIKCADVVLTKAGGSTVQECISSNTPIILTHVVPGQEEGNAELITKHQMGIDITASEMPLSKAVTEILKNKEKYITNLKKLSSPKAALKVAAFLDKIVI